MSRYEQGSEIENLVNNGLGKKELQAETYKQGGNGCAGV